MTKPILCLDFDGVIHSYTSGWKGIDVVADPPVPGAFDFIREASKVFRICILSSRSHQEGGVEAMKKWFYHHLIKWRDQLNESEPLGSASWITEIDFPREKPAAFLTLDDRALCFKGEWPSVSELLAFKPWYK